MSYPGKKQRRNGTGIALAVAAMWAAGVSAGAAAGVQVKAGDRLPALATCPMEGTVPNLQGKIVVVDFWASWCGPCRKSFPEWNAIQQQYKDQGLVVVGINMDAKCVDKEKFLATCPVSFPIVRDSNQAYVKSVCVNCMPTSLIVDRKGVIRYVHNGFKGQETLALVKKQIEELLAEKS